MRKRTVWITACLTLAMSFSAIAQEKPRPRPPEDPKRVEPKDPKRIDTKDPKRVEPRAVDPKDKYARGQRTGTFNNASGAKPDARTDVKDKAPARAVDPKDKYAKNQIRDKFNSTATNAPARPADKTGNRGKEAEKKGGDKNGNAAPPSAPAPKPPTPR